MKIHGRVELNLHAFLTSAVFGGGGGYGSSSSSSNSNTDRLKTQHSLMVA